MNLGDLFIFYHPCEFFLQCFKFHYGGVLCAWYLSQCSIAEKRCYDLSIYLPTYLSIFKAIMNEIVMLISFSVCLYRKATDFHMLILYLVTLLKVLVLNVFC